MAKIRDIILPPELEAVLLEWLDHMPNKFAQELCLVVPGGFRNPNMMRERVRVIVRGTGPLPDWLLALIRQYLPVSEQVSMLSEEGLRDAFDDLAKVFVAPLFLLALLSDERPGVQKLAVERLKTAGQQVSAAEMEAARSRWMGAVYKCFLPFATLPTAAAQHAPVNPDELQQANATVAKQQQAITDLKNQLERDRAAHGEVRRQLEARLNEQVESTRRISEQIETFQKTSENLKQATHDAIQAGVRAELAAVERKWLGDAIAVDSLVAEVSSNDLLVRAGQALEAQKQMDQHSGNRLELQRRLEALRKATKDLNDARQNAIHPIDALRTVAEDVANEIARIESKLGVVAVADGVAAQLLQQINESTDFAALDKCSTLIDSLAERGLLTGEKARPHYEMLQRRHDILSAQQQRKAGDDNWLSLRTLVHHNRDCLLLLDGHNILFALDHLRALFDNGKPASKARKQLVELMKHLLANRPNIQARIVFDGPIESETNEASNLKVEFSGGEGDQRADDAIVRNLLEDTPQTPKLPTFVVTNDRFLQKRILERQAYYMPVGAFDVMLRDFQCLEQPQQLVTDSASLSTS